MESDHYEVKYVLDDVIQAVIERGHECLQTEEIFSAVNEGHDRVRPVSPKSPAPSVYDVDPAESSKEEDEEEEGEEGEEREKVHRTGDDNDFEPDLSQWFTRKKELELKAERRARTTCKRWQQDRRSLEDIIDSSLKEYIELYETAHAIRLQFEEEKAKWTASLLSTLSEKMPHAMGPPMQFQYEVHQTVPTDDAEPRSRGLKRSTEDNSLDLPVAPLGARKKFVAPTRVPM